LETVTVDEEAGWVYVLAHGDQERPYDTHLYRVNLEGQGYMQLTEATGQHEIQFAPSKEFFIDTHSTVDRPPTVELRKADGTLLRTLSKANIDALHGELRWRPPEEFVVQAADGATDLWGVLFKPHDFSPDRKYPVIEVIYGGAWSSVAPKSFTDYLAYYAQAPALAQLGFVTFIVDGRGTPERGRDFQNVVYGNKGRFEIPDHVAALNQLAAERSYMDLGRVGILGHSQGGYLATRALLLAPDVYDVGIASAPILFPTQGPDFQFMPPPAADREAHEYASNLRLAGNLEGKLFLLHGTSDTNAPFSHTMKMVDALIQAEKPYDLAVFPGIGHSLWRETYWQDTVSRYFQEHLRPGERKD
jgi:dipeptidyl aminopeptidase/acylaminoacyl peptidase